MSRGVRRLGKGLGSPSRPLPERLRWKKMPLSTSQLPRKGGRAFHRPRIVWEKGEQDSVPGAPPLPSVNDPGGLGEGASGEQRGVTECGGSAGHPGRSELHSP